MRILKRIIKWILGLGIASISILILGLTIRTSKQMPTYEEIEQQITSNTKRYINIDEIPEKFKENFITEIDKNFYKYEFPTIRNIIEKTLLEKEKRTSSLISSTLSKKYISEKHKERKQIEKQFLRAILEYRLDKIIRKEGSNIKIKEKILERYLNSNYFGKYEGIATASNAYFGKEIPKTTKSEQIFLIASNKYSGRYKENGFLIIKTEDQKISKKIILEIKERKEEIAKTRATYLSKKWEDKGGIEISKIKIYPGKTLFMLSKIKKDKEILEKNILEQLEFLIRKHEILFTTLGTAG